MTKKQPEVYDSTPEELARVVARLSYVLGMRATLTYHDTEVDQKMINRVQEAREELDNAVSWLLNSMQRQVITNEQRAYDTDTTA